MNKKEYFEYLNKQQIDSRIIDMKEYAKINHVPIIQENGLNFILQIIKLAKVDKILEIGCAIGYSAINFALANTKMKIQTIERNEKMVMEARKNIAKFQLEKQIDLIYGDALDIEIHPNESFDLIFIDAAKSQYQKFFEKYTPYLRPGGIVVTDNLIFHEMVFEDYIENKNTRQLVNKIKKYNEWLRDNGAYDTHFFDIGDGIAISIKK